MPPRRLSGNGSDGSKRGKSEPRHDQAAATDADADAEMTELDSDARAAAAPTVETAAPVASAAAEPAKFFAVHTNRRRVTAAAQDAAASAAAAASTPKRRGRKSKLPKLSEAGGDAAAGGDDDCIDLTLSPSDDDAEAEAAAAGSSASAASAAASQSLLSKRTRGRPRKSSLSALDTSAASASSAAAAASARSASTVAPSSASSAAAAAVSRSASPVLARAAKNATAADENSLPLAKSHSRSPAAAKAASPAVANAAAAASPSPAAVVICAHCPRAFTHTNEANLRAHEESCAKRTPEERVKHNAKALQRRANKLAAAAKGAASSSKSTPAKRKRASSSGGSAGAGPVLSARLLKAVGYDLDGDDAETVQKKKVYEVEAVRSRRFNRDTLQYEYELKWLGWPESDNTWEPAKDTHCRELIHKFHCDAEEVLTLQIDEAVEMAASDPPAVAFHRDGLCSLTSPSLTLALHDVIAVEEKVSKLFNSTLKSITNRDQLDLLETRGFDNFKLRDRGRYDMTLNISDFSCFENPPWLPVVQQILGGQARLQHFGCMMSLPSSATQNWHSDGPHRSKHTHLPAYMLNCFVPLVDMTRALGGTQIQPGSHVHHDFMIRTTSVTPLVKAGQCLLFDYRIRHRGLENRDTKARPVLYFTYSASDDIVDEANFKRGRYAPLLPPIVTLEESREERLRKRRRARGEESSDEEEEEEEEEEEDGEEEEEESEEGEEEETKEESKDAASEDAAAAASASSSSSAAAASSPAAAAPRKRGRPSGSRAAASAAAANSAAASASAVPASPSDSASSAGASPADVAAGRKQRGESKSDQNPRATASHEEPIDLVSPDVEMKDAPAASLASAASRKSISSLLD